MDSYFAVVAPGLESFAFQEMEELGLLSNSNDLSRPYEEGGVSFKGTREDLYRANLHLRTPNRVLARLGNFFHAATFPDLEERSSRLPWERFISPGQPVTLRVTCHQSKLYHSDAVARTVGKGISRRMGTPSPLFTAQEENDSPSQLVIVRLVEDRCTVSIDSSGALLHKRGYRQAVAKAPLRETLAAGLILASGWDRYSPLLDPFCGSGTIPIEAALMARGIPPGLHRRFAFMNWPDFDAGIWDSLVQQTKNIEVALPVIQASDRDAGAIRMAEANAERAGVAGKIEFSHQAISAIEPKGEAGWVVTNPPYGQRVSPGKDLRDLYARFGDVLREKCPGWNVTLLCSDPVLLGQMRMELDTSLRLDNGGIAVRVARGQVG